MLKPKLIIGEYSELAVAQERIQRTCGASFLSHPTGLAHTFTLRQQIPTPEGRHATMHALRTGFEVGANALLNFAPRDGPAHTHGRAANPRLPRPRRLKGRV